VIDSILTCHPCSHVTTNNYSYLLAIQSIELKIIVVARLTFKGNVPTLYGESYNTELRQYGLNRALSINLTTYY
jgi:hypothetical protein